MDKLTGLASLLAVILAIVAGVMPNLGFDAGMIILILGIIAGISADQDNAIRMYIAVLVLPVVAAGLGGLEAVGVYLSGIFGNLAVAATGISATLIARKVYEMAMGNVQTLTGGGGD
jgi:hypothetical protein